MSRRKIVGPAEPVYLVDENGDEYSSSSPMLIGARRWHYIGGEVITPGGVSALCTIPADATIVELAANGEDLYYILNAGDTASALAPGFIAEGGRELIGPLDNLNALAIFMAGVNTTHIQYFREA